MKPLVYLAGPIAGTGPYEATNWREAAASALLNNYGIESLSPMRAKDELAEQTIANDFRQYAGLGPFFTSRGIMTRDFSDVRRCDALLVNLLGTKQPSLGTVMELAWAYAMQKPVVVAMELHGNPHDNHPMLYEAMPFRIAALDEAIDAVAVILGR